MPKRFRAEGPRERTILSYLPFTGSLYALADQVGYGSPSVSASLRHLRATGAIEYGTTTKVGIGHKREVTYTIVRTKS